LAVGQIIPDANLPSTSKVQIQGEASIITGGTKAGPNLFHSFKQFSIPTGSKAYFNNPPEVGNIIGRVTGLSITNIDGLLQTNGTANLFLLNPNGVIFGPNSSLNVGGSFLASTASSLNFSDGKEFDAKPSQPSALLTTSVPVDLRFAAGAGSIQVKGTGHTLTNTAVPGIPITGAGRSATGLRVSPGRTLALAGGDVTLGGGVLTAPSGRIELGAVDSGLVKLNSIASSWALGFEEAQAFRDIQLSQRALLDVSGNGGGSIQLQGRNITLEGGSIGLIQNQGSSPAEAISVNTSNSLLLSGTSPNGKIPTGLRSQTLGAGSGADILISTQQLIQQNGGGTISTVYGAGKGGNVSIIAPKSIQLLGIVPLNPFITSNISASTYSFGDAGNIRVSTGQLTVRDGGFIGSTSLGKGSGSNVLVTADFIELIGAQPEFGTSSAINATAFTEGNAGNLTIHTSRLAVKDGASVNTVSLGTGNGGSISIIAPESVDVSGYLPGYPEEAPSTISASVSKANPDLQEFFGSPAVPTGNSGSVSINTKYLTIIDNGIISVINRGTGNAGDIVIDPELIKLDHGTIAASTTNGNGGNITLEGGNFQLLNNSLVSTEAGKKGNGGNIILNVDLLTLLNNSRISANAEEEKGGKVAITTEGYFRSPDSQVSAKGGIPKLNGTVEINTSQIEFSRATAQPVQGPQIPKVAVACSGAVANKQAEFINAPAGGLPPSAAEILNGDSEWHGDLPSYAQAPVQPIQPSDLDDLPEVQSIVRNPDGTVSLSAAPPARMTSSLPPTATACR